jgi:hypothetical protein
VIEVSGGDGRLLKIPIISAYALEQQQAIAYKLIIVRPGISLLASLAGTDKWWLR